MTPPRRVHVHALDPVSAAGLASELRGHPLIEITENADEADRESVAVVAVDVLDEPAVQLIRTARRHGCRHVVLICGAPQEIDLMAAVDLGVCAVVPRSEAIPSRLVQIVLGAAAGEAAMPADLLGRLLSHFARLQHDVLAPRGLTVTGLAEREAQILKLVAEGLDTREIALRLNYSERTVKNVLHDITTRFQLRNRSHAVAYAMREGLI